MLAFWLDYLYRPEARSNVVIYTLEHLVGRLWA